MDSLKDFPWNGNTLVKKVYNEKHNFVVSSNNNKKDKKRAVIFFSSNDLYYPNNEETFQRRIVEEDHYEWVNLSKVGGVKKTYQKMIYVRDVYKQWYICGINKEINNMDKLIAFLRKETEGYKVTTCGSSSGGYAAIAVGTGLGAEVILCNSAQFDIRKDSIFAEKYENDKEKSKWFNLYEYMQGYSEHIFYIMPINSKQDITQNAYIEGIAIHRLNINSSIHGKTVDPLCFPNLLSLSYDKLVFFFDSHNGKYDKDEISYELLSFTERTLNKTIRVIKRLKSKLQLK